MKSLRVLLLSNARPRRVSRFTTRIIRELPDAEICGIVQRPLPQLPVSQQCIAMGETSSETDGPKGYGLRRLIWSLLYRIGHFALWVIHGFPANRGVSTRCTVRDLQKSCAQNGWPFLQADELSDPAVGAFIRERKPDLIITFGEISAFPEAAFDPALGFLLARQTEICAKDEKIPQGSHIRIEHFDSSFAAPHTLASFRLPRQVYDGLLGFTLKADLLIDDLLMLAVSSVSQTGVGGLEKTLTEWVEDILVPYLSQTGRTPTGARPKQPDDLRIRSIGRLSVQTGLLCFPSILLRNWVRRIRQRYPVLILTHHVVTDRQHRMGISTEVFWRQVQFLVRHYRIVSLSEAAEMLGTGRVDRPVVSLTFDDGYADNFVSLRAVAEEMGIPVAIFVTTQPVTLHSEFQHDLVRGIRGAFAMTWGQIRYWQAHGGEFGSHTRTHIKCGLVDDEALDDEIAGSKVEFEAQLNKAPTFFAFPYGDQQNMPPVAARMAMSAYPYILSSFGGENLPNNNRDNAHLYRKKAYADPWELELELQSVFDLVERAKRLFVKSEPPQPASAGLERSPETAKVRQDIVFEQPADQLGSHRSSRS